MAFQPLIDNCEIVCCANGLFNIYYMKSRKLLSWALGFIVASAFTSLRAGTFNANFNDGLVPPDTSVYGNTVIESTGGVGGSGVLKLTKALGSQTGSFIISDLDNGAPVYGFRASMMVRIGGGSPTPADGWSFNFAPDLPDGPISVEGAGGGLTISFDTYVNTDVGEVTPTIDLKIGGSVVSSWTASITNLVTGSNFVPLNIRLNANGSFDLDLNNQVIFTNLFFPNYAGIAGGRFGLGANTGGLYANHFIDDLSIETLPQPVIGITRQPADITVLVGRKAEFSVALNNSEGGSLQWLRNGQPIAGAIDASYSLEPVVASDDGAKFSIKITANGASLTSQEAGLHATTIAMPANPVLSYNFNDGAVPANTAVFGNAVVDSIGGIGDSGVLKLTLAENGQSGAFIVEDPHNGAPVYGFATSFQIRIGGGSAVPADGFSFNFASDLPNAATGDMENPAGTGVSVTFDTYDNAGGEAPGVELRINRTVVASKKVPVDFLITGDGFVDVEMLLGQDGLFRLAWNGVVLFDGVKADGFSSTSGGRFGFNALTGGLNANYWVDDIKLFTYTNAGNTRITAQPKSQMILLGKDAVFSVGVNDSSNVSYRWFRNGQLVAGANLSAYTLPNAGLSDDQTKIKVEVTDPNNQVTSDEAILTVVNLAPPANPQVTFDFNNGSVPSSTRVIGTAFVDATGGVSDSGVLKLTLAQESQSGVFLVEPLLGGAEINGFTAAFAVRLGEGTSTPADGFSFNFADNLPNATFGDSEDGAGTGITVAFDVYDNGGGEAPSIDLKYKGQVVVSKKVPLALLVTGSAYVEVLVRVRSDGLFDLAYGNEVVFNGQPIPGFTPIANGRFGFAARTGGLYANFWIDDIRLAVTKTTGPTRITGQPTDALMLAGQAATFSVLVNDPVGVTYQWYRNGSAILSATQANFTTGSLSLSDNGSLYSVKATGSGGATTSDSAKLSVMAPFSAPADSVISFDFNDGAVPPGSVVLGNAFVDATGGVNDSGVLKLTVAVNDQTGDFLSETPAGVTAIQDLVASWKVRVGGGTPTAADGFCFVLGSDIQDVTFREEGAGTGLILSFDTYDNGGGEAPAIDVLYGGDTIASRKLPIGVLRTGDVFAEVDLRVNRDGTLDLIYGTNAIFFNLALPGYKPFDAGRFGFGAATGGSNDDHWIDDLRLAVNIAPNSVKITVSRKTDGKLQIVWDGAGVLQEAASLPGSWSDISTTGLSYEVAPTNTMRFFRVRP